MLITLVTHYIGSSIDGSSKVEGQPYEDNQQFITTISLLFEVIGAAALIIFGLLGQEGIIAGTHYASLGLTISGVSYLFIMALGMAIFGHPELWGDDSSSTPARKNSGS